MKVGIVSLQCLSEFCLWHYIRLMIIKNKFIRNKILLCHIHRNIIKHRKYDTYFAKYVNTISNTQTQGKIDKITIDVNRSLIYKFQDISN